MSDFVNIFQEVLCIATLQPREARMRYRLPEREETMRAAEMERLVMIGERWRMADAEQRGQL